MKQFIVFLIEQYILVLILILEAIYNQIHHLYSLVKPPPHPALVLERKLQQVLDYQEWISTAQELDNIHGYQYWRQVQETDLCDVNLILSRIEKLNDALDTKDVSSMKLLIRSGLLRNLGGITDIRLFQKSYLGTKHFIETYLGLVVQSIQFISDLDSIIEPNSQKLDMFTEVAQSFGNTALLLHGGATFGLYHLGVVKALYKADLLPRIISGSSVGALIAALVCTRSEDDIESLFDPAKIDLQAFSTKTTKGSFRRKITRLLTKGYLLDVNVLEECVKANLGDITFEEAFEKSGRVLNITVSSSRKNEIPSVLNYLTAPNVLIRSAACASASMIGLYKAVDLLAKDQDGKIFSWSATNVKWGKYHSENDSPEQRLAELFNVNHFILSQAQPYIAPFLRTQSGSGYSQAILRKALGFISSEIRFRMSQLSRLGLIPQTLGSLFDLKMVGHVTIAPPLSSTDFYTIFSNPTYESLNYWLLKGQQSTWPYLAMIKSRLLIEMKLNQVKSQTQKAIEAERKTDYNPRSAIKRNQSLPN